MIDHANKAILRYSYIQLGHYLQPKENPLIRLSMVSQILVKSPVYNNHIVNTAHSSTILTLSVMA